MFGRSRYRRPRYVGQVRIATPPELGEAIRAYTWNLVTNNFAGIGASEIPAVALRNPLAASRFELPPRPAAKAEADISDDIPFDPDDIPFCAQEEEPERPSETGWIEAARAKVANQWGLEGLSPQRVPVAEAHVGRGIRLTGRVFGFSALDRAVLQFALALRMCGALFRLFCVFRTARREDLVALVACALGTSATRVRGRLTTDSPLLASGIVSVVNNHSPSQDLFLLVEPRIPGLITQRGLTRDRLLAAFLVPDQPPTLTMGDFDHLRPELEAARKLLTGAKATGQAGVNILLYGGTGTGKTEAARVLAAAAGANLFTEARASEEDDPPSPAGRLSKLRAGQRLISASGDLLVFGEMQDLFSGSLPFGFDGESQGLSKEYFTHHLEENHTPTMWTTNVIDQVDPAYLRRFTMVIHFPALGEVQRRRVWVRHSRGQLSAQELDDWSRYDLSPGEIASALRAAFIAGGDTLDRTTLLQVVTCSVRLVPGRRTPQARRADKEYTIKALNTSMDLSRLTESVREWTPGSRLGVSILLSGPSGTGKSEYAHHLAACTARPLVVKRVSDIESCFVGGTERNIARAFEEADLQGAILLMDEADSFLRDRSFATHGWEQTKVNQFLQELESFKGIIVCTTNFLGDLDRAVLRRFSFKVEFHPLLLEQALLMWEAHLSPVCQAPHPTRHVLTSELRQLPGLTPGDFSNVARRAAQLGGTWTAKDLLRELARELDGRGRGPRPLGFSKFASQMGRDAAETGPFSPTLSEA